MKGNLKNKSAGFYLNLAAVVLGIIGCVVYMVYAAQLGVTMTDVIGLLAAGIVLCLAAAFTKLEFLVLGGVFAFSFATFRFAACSETVGSIVDKVNSIVAFGHQEYLGIIFTAIVFMLLASVASVVGCFLHNEKPTAQG